jgi:hypothetical protein
MMRLDIEMAFGMATVIWVALSWIKLFITPRKKIYKYLCSKCISFWGTLILTLNPFTAATAALIAMLIEYIEENKTIKL